MKRTRFTFLIFAVLTLVAAPSVSRAQLPLEEIAVTLLADRFGVDPAQIVGFLDRSDLSVFEAAPYYSTSYYTDDPVDEVWRLREQGLGWGQVAQRLGMHPGTFNKLRKSGAFDRDEIWESIYEDRYGVRESDIDLIRRRGGSMRDVLPASIIARASRTSPVTVFQRFRTTRNWDRTANYYKTDLRRHRDYARKSVRPSKSITRVSAGAAKSKAAVKGRAHRTIRSKSPGSSGAAAKARGAAKARTFTKQSGKGGGQTRQMGKGQSGFKHVSKGRGSAKQSGVGRGSAKGGGKSTGKGGGKGHH